MVLTRRALLQGAFATGVGLAVGGASFAYMTRRGALQLTRVTLPVRGLPAALRGFRIGLMTDIHRSQWVDVDDVQRAVTTLMGARPDLIALGGDYVTWADRHYIEPAAEALAPLTAPHGVFAVLGNHDDEREVPAALERRGITVLKDRRARVVIGSTPLDLLGVRFWTRRATEIAPLLKGAAATVVLLAHDPRRFREARALGIPLVLSGHTHGGQVVLPVVGAVAARRFPVVSGMATASDTSLFVSRGIGTVYLPVRINCPPEVAVLTLDVG